jgi:hypothetical protein
MRTTPEPQRFDPRWIIARHRDTLINAAPEPWRPQIAAAFDEAYRSGFVLDEVIAHALRVLDQRDMLRHELLRTGEVEPTDESKRLSADLHMAPALLLGTAARLLDAGDVVKAWCVADLAAQIIEGLRFKEGERFVASLRGKRGLRERHKDNRADRQFVIQWWAKHKAEFRSKDEAAEAIVRARLVHESVRTVRDWLKGA